MPTGLSRRWGSGPDGRWRAWLLGWAGVFCAGCGSTRPLLAWRKPHPSLMQGGTPTRRLLRLPRWPRRAACRPSLIREAGRVRSRREAALQTPGRGAGPPDRPQSKSHGRGIISACISRPGCTTRPPQASGDGLHALYCLTLRRSNWITCRGTCSLGGQSPRTST